MNEPKPFASLGPTLLARKGGARPAMRPQLAAMGNLGGAQAAQKIAEDLEDLGWNDMGDDEEARTGEVLPLTPAPANPDADAVARADDAQARAELAIITPIEPQVRRQQQSIAETFDVADEPPSRPLRKRKADAEAARRAAFTLRLDAKRHLKLRLASTVKNRSAQQLVTQALDKYLSEIPEIEALAAQVARD